MWVNGFCGEWKNRQKRTDHLWPMHCLFRLFDAADMKECHEKSQSFYIENNIKKTLEID
jgi:hypothetical protein